MAGHGGRVQLEQSNRRLALNMEKMANEGFSRAAIEERKQLIKKPRTEVREEKKQGVVFPGHNKVKAAIERHTAIVQENLTDCCVPCQNGTAKNAQTHWRHKGTDAPPARLLPPSPGMHTAPPDETESTESSKPDGLPPGYVYIHTPLHSARFFNRDPYANDPMRNEDFIPDLLTDEGPSTG